MTKRTRIPRPCRAPTLVAMLNTPSYELAELAALQALRAGQATVQQFDVLVDCRNLLALGAARRDEEGPAAVADLASIAIGNIRDRYTRTGRIVAQGDELQALHQLLDVAHDFWRRQGGGTFTECHAALVAWCNSPQQGQQP